jgi:hypothetical protein
MRSARATAFGTGRPMRIRRSILRGERQVIYTCRVISRRRAKKIDSYGMHSDGRYSLYMDLEESIQET